MKTTTAILALTSILGFATAGLVYADDSNLVAALDTKPGPAFQTIDGTVSKIDGNIYVVEQSITNYRGEEIKENEVRVYVSEATKKLHGKKKVGDKIRVELTRGGFANTIE
jgi:hypothetical protein